MMKVLRSSLIPRLLTVAFSYIFEGRFGRAYGTPYFDSYGKARRVMLP